MFNPKIGLSCLGANWIWCNLSGFRTQRSLTRTWESVAAPVREEMTSPLHYSPTSSSHSVLCTAACSTSTTRAKPRVRTFSQHMCLYVFPQTAGRQTSVVGRKSFWQLLSWNDSLPHLVGLLVVKLLGFVFCFFVFKFFSPLHLRELLWPVHPPCPLCQVSGRAAFVTQSDRSGFSPPPRLHNTEPGHHENLEAAEELCLSDLRSPRLVPVHGGRECWQHGSQHTGGWAGDMQLLFKCISHWLVFIYFRLFWHSVVKWTFFSVMSHQDTCSVKSSVYNGVPLLYF